MPNLTLRINLAATYFEQENREKAEPLYRYIAVHSNDPTLLAIAWARLAIFVQDKQRLEALEQALRYCFETDFRVAHIRVGISVLELGTARQRQTILPLLKGKVDFDAITEQELKTALAKHGLSYPL